MQAIALCTKLESLKIVGLWRVSDKDITKIGEYCPLLWQLHIEGCSGVTEISMARLRLKIKDIDRPQAPGLSRSLPLFSNRFGINLQI